jgi:hypothetical protein
MMSSFFSRFASFLLTCSLAAGAAFTVDAHAQSVVKYRVDVPPSNQLDYSIQSRQKGISLDGSAVMQWTVADGKFTATNTVRAMLFGKILEAQTEGRIEGYGLAPASFTEKRLRKDASTTTFDRSAKVIRFTGSEQTYPIKGGEQDQNSVVWQLVSVARAAGAKFKPGSEWKFFVANQRDAEQWTFKVVKKQKIRTPLGEMDTLHVMRKPAGGADDQQLDIWLAPEREWYPARLRFTEVNGDFIEQTLNAIGGKSN